MPVIIGNSAPKIYVGDYEISNSGVIPKTAYYGTLVPKTIADCQHFEYAEFSTADYSQTTAFAAMMVAAAQHFTFDSVSTPSAVETSLTYGNATARTYGDGGSYAYVTLVGTDDFTLRANTPWNAKYIINSKAIMLSAPRATSGVYTEYTAFGFGKMGNNVKAGVWSSYYNSNYRQGFSWGLAPNSYEDTRPIGGSTNTDIGLVQSPINGIYQVIYGDPYAEGFYEVDGAIFFVCSGIAIKDE